jgi:hypothetical protein
VGHLFPLSAERSIWQAVVPYRIAARRPTRPSAHVAMPGAFRPGSAAWAAMAINGRIAARRPRAHVATPEALATGTRLPPANATRAAIGAITCRIAAGRLRPQAALSAPAPTMRRRDVERGSDPRAARAELRLAPTNVFRNS